MTGWIVNSWLHTTTFWRSAVLLSSNTCKPAVCPRPRGKLLKCCSIRPICCICFSESSRKCLYWEDTTNSSIQPWFARLWRPLLLRGNAYMEASNTPSLRFSTGRRNTSEIKKTRTSCGACWFKSCPRSTRKWRNFSWISTSIRWVRE